MYLKIHQNLRSEDLTHPIWIQIILSRHLKNLIEVMHSRHFDILNDYNDSVLIWWDSIHGNLILTDMHHDSSNPESADIADPKCPPNMLKLPIWVHILIFWKIEQCYEPF